MVHCLAGDRYGEKGFAIGPILLIVAILAVLTMAFASSNNSFTVSSSSQSNKVVASTVMGQGSDMRTAADRVISNGFLITDVTYTGAATQADLFSVAGGGTAQPIPPAQALTSTSNNYSFITTAKMNGVGTAGAASLAVVLPIKQAICQQVDDVLFSNSTVPTATASANSLDLTGAAAAQGWQEGCIQSGGVYYYFKLLVPA